MENTKTPKLRFPGFTDDWEQRKLSDCCGQLSETLNPQDTPDDVFAEYSMPAFDNGEVPDIVVGKTMNSARKIIDRPCLLINKLNVRKKRIWNVEKPEKNAVSSAEFVPVYSDDINLSFLKDIVLSDAFTAYLEECSSGSSNSQKRVTPDIIMSAAFMFPSKGEQDKIAEFFENIDNLITLHQRKLDGIKEYKNGLLQKMFPKEGEKVPELRFPGFTDDWEQRKLGELGQFKNGMNFSKDAMDKGYPFVNLQNIFGKNIIDIENLGLAEATDNQLKEYNLKVGDVLFVRSSVKLEGVGEAAIVPKDLENTTYSGFVIRFRDESDMDINFKRFIFGTKHIRNQIMAKATNSANKNISQDVLNNLELYVPEKSEQERIGEFFSDLDNLITLHQRKLNEMQNYKKGLLQQMFI